MRPPRGLSFRSRCGCPVAAFVVLTAVGGLCLVVALHPIAWPQQPPPTRVRWRTASSKAGRRVISSSSEDDAATVGQLPASDTETAAVHPDASAGQQDTAGAMSFDSAAARSALAAARASEGAVSARRNAIESLPEPVMSSVTETAIAQPSAAVAKTSANVAKTSAVLSARRVGAPSEPPDRATLAVCLVTRIDADDPQWLDGKAEDLHEWVEHHKRLGVGRIYVFDHGSEVPLNTTLRRHIASKLVQYEYSTMGFHNSTGGRVSPQLVLYQQCLQRFGRRHRFMAFIDSDEFFSLPVQRQGAPQTLPELLNAYAFVRPFGGLVVPWIMFGPSGHKSRPRGGVLANYWKCLPRANGHSRHVKTIVNTRHAVEMISPHHWTYEERFYAIDENLERADGPFVEEGKGSVNRIALHHYVTKSLQDFNAKSKRGDGMGDSKQMPFYEEIEGLATEDCSGARDSILRQSGKLKSSAAAAAASSVA